MNIGQYGKAITYIALAAVAFLTTALTDNELSTEELLNLVVVVLGAIGVYAIPNFPESVARYAKTGVAFLTAGVIAGLSFYTDGVTTTEWLQIILAAFAAVGVYIVPNTVEKAVQAVEVVNAEAVAGEIADVVAAEPVAEDEVVHGGI